MEQRLRWKCVCVLAACAILVTVAGAARAEKIVDLVENGGFEKPQIQPGEVKPPAGPYGVYHTGKLRLTRDPDEVHTGTQAVHFEWRQPPKGGYSAFYCQDIPVLAGTPYTLTFWAKGKGHTDAWISKYGVTGQFSGTDFGSGFKLQQNRWQKFERRFTPPEGIAHVNIYFAVGSATVTALDDLAFTFDAEKYPPPEKPAMTVRSDLKGTACDVELLVNGKRVTEPLVVGHGEYVLALRARATGEAPSVGGEIALGEFQVRMDGKWKALPLPDGDEWAKVGFDDRIWKPAKVTGRGIWDDAGSKAIALRKVVVWRSKQWIPFIRERMFLPQGSTQSWITSLRLGYWQEEEGSLMFSNTASDEWTLYLEAPAFLDLLPKRDTYGSPCFDNVFPREIKKTPFKKHGKNYVRYTVRYGVNDYRAGVNASHGALYFKVDRNAPLGPDEYSWRYWREANGNQTDIPEEIPITVTGPINGRQCKYFELWYTRPPVNTGGGWAPLSEAERYALTEDMLASGMNRTYLVAYFPEKPDRVGLREYWKYLSDKGVRFAYGWNDGMNFPFRITKEDYDWREKRPAHGRLFEGDPDKFKEKIGVGFHPHGWDRKSRMGILCQEYVATSEDHYRALLQKYKDIRKEFPGVYLLFWDWEYNPDANSCFCPTCKEAFGRFAGIPNAVQLSDDDIVDKYPSQWHEFRMDQSARHAAFFIRLFRKIGVEMTVWPGQLHSGEFETDRLKGVMKEGHIAWSGGLPPGRTLRTTYHRDLWAKEMPGTKLVGQIICGWHPNALLDERRYKIYTLTMAVNTPGGYEFWNVGPVVPESAGMRYFVGEATRMIADFDEFYFRDGTCTREGFSSDLENLDFWVIQRPDRKRALVLAYNDKDKARNATVKCRHAGARVRIWPSKDWKNGKKFTFEIPPVDVLALEYRY